MLRPLSNAARRALILWSVSLCTGSALLVPLAARSAGDAGSVGTDTVPSFRTPDVPRDGSPARILLTHDPFRPDEPPSEPPKDATGDHGSGDNAIVGATVVAGTPLGALPHGDTSIVSAIITGRDAEALVVRDGRSEILSVGGMLDGVRIVSITADGVRLANGSLRRVYEDHP